MGFAGETLKNMNGIEWFYIAGILIFIVLFFIMLFRILRIPKKDLMKYKNSILDQEDSTTDHKNSK